MLRYLLAFLVVIVGVLAILFDNHLWLRAGAGVAIVGGLGLLGWQFWSASREEEEERRPTSESKAPSESLEDLGIVAIRPEGAESTEPNARARPLDEGEAGLSSSDAGSSGATPVTEPPSKTGRADTAASGTDRTASARQPVVTEDAPVLGPFLQSLCAALGAQTVCLLVQEKVALTYRIEALASTHAQVRQSGAFDTQTPLLTASMSRQSVSVHSLTEAEVAIEDLRYYDDPPEVDHFAVAPVPQPDEPSTTFLLADATAQSDLGSSRARTLLEHFAETVALLSTSEESDGEQAPAQADGEEAISSSEIAASTEEEGENGPRPRREIIAEEMDAAEAASEDLALVLVHLNRAESIARRGEEAVASAERLLRARLEQVSPNYRVERFGELTFGIFFRGDADSIEPWAADLEATMAQEEGELEGGVSVGVAVWGDSREDPETLRADATDALHEAYKTGTCTIVT